MNLKVSPREVSASALRESGVLLSGEDLTIEKLVRVARDGEPVRLTRDPDVLDRIERSREYVLALAMRDEPVYGVTTGFGGMANRVIPQSEASALQENLFHFMRLGAGGFIPAEDVRASMLVRANSHLRGASGLRLEIIERIVTFLNRRVTPRVREFGSIGASGDLSLKRVLRGEEVSPG